MVFIFMGMVWRHLLSAALASAFCYSLPSSSFSGPSLTKHVTVAFPSQAETSTNRHCLSGTIMFKLHQTFTFLPMV